MALYVGGSEFSVSLTRFHVVKSSNQNLSSNAGSNSSPPTPQVITFNQITDGSNNAINPDGLFASNKFTVTAATAGIYQIYYTLHSDTTASQIFVNGYAGIYVNGTLHSRSNFVDHSNGTSSYYANGNKSAKAVDIAIVDLTTNGDYVEVRATAIYNGTGTTGRIVVPGTGANHFGGFKVGS